MEGLGHEGDDCVDLEKIALTHTLERNALAWSDRESRESTRLVCASKVALARARAHALAWSDERFR